jgi:hypothetical protein
MCKNVEIVNVEQDGKDGVIIVFSDGTQGAYVVEELLGLRPSREVATGLIRNIHLASAPLN